MAMIARDNFLFERQDEQWTHHAGIFKEPGFVQIEDMQHTLARQMQEFCTLQKRQQKIQEDAYAQMVHQLHGDVGPSSSVDLDKISKAWKAQLAESELLRESHQQALRDLNNQFQQEAAGYWDLGFDGFGRQHARGLDFSQEGQREVKQSKLPDDRLGNMGATTLMVRNIPVRYTQEMLLKEWPNQGTYDFLYLPICIKKKCNTSFAFINFVTPQHARDFAEKWHHERLLFFSARKPLDISLADLQGLEKNLLQCMNNKTSRIRNVRFQPAVFNGNERVSVDNVLREMQELKDFNLRVEEEAVIIPGTWRL